MKPLSDVTVVSVARLLPAEYLTLLLTHLGARVIKIDNPKSPDYFRFTPPMKDDMSVYFKVFGANKESLAVNWGEPKGAEVVKRLVAKADIFIESFRPGVIEKAGFGYEAMKAANERLIYCSVTGYGANGPLSSKAGHDLNFNSYAGTLDPSLAEGGTPRMPAVLFGDMGGALAATAAITAALYGRERSGAGRKLDIALCDVAAHLISMAGAEFIATGKYRPEDYFLTGKYPRYRIYKAKAGFVAFAALEPKFWKTFCEVVGRTDLLDMEMEKLGDELVKLFASRTRDEWMTLFEEKDACISPVLSVDEAVRSANFSARGVFRRASDGGNDTEYVMGGIFGLSDENATDFYAAPREGEHSRAILLEFGFDERDIEEMKREGVIKEI
ncbi:MAG: CoA transferase [Myxococcota bacterium]